MTAIAQSSQYALATGHNAVGRLSVLHGIYSPVGRQVLLEAGLKRGMDAADFGCGTGTMTRLLASMVGPEGSVTGIDANTDQLEQAAQWCNQQDRVHTRFVAADACDTGLVRNSFDLVYCRFLLLHLPDPAACLEEMWRVLKPGGIIVIEDGDLASARSVPPTALDAFARLFSGLGPIRGVDYSIENRLAQLVADVGFTSLGMRVHQPAERAGAPGLLLKWSVEEAGPAFVESGLITSRQLEDTVVQMARAVVDRNVLAMAPRMSLVWGKKPAQIPS
jgi:SAM-dependent methyltransferase